MSFQGLSEDADGDGWVTKLRGKSIPGQRLDEENAREPNVDVDVRGRTICDWTDYVRFKFEYCVQPCGSFDHVIPI